MQHGMLYHQLYSLVYKTPIKYSLWLIQCPLSLVTRAKCSCSPVEKGLLALSTISHLLSFNGAACRHEHCAQ